jgi:hypothetical protein
MSTEGLKAELATRLQARLDEEEFGLAEAPNEAASAKESAAPSPAPSPAEKKATESKPATTSIARSVEEAKPAKESAAAKDDKSEAAAAPVRPTGKVVDTKGMTFEDKKKARMQRFGIVNEADKKKARAERFGIPDNKTNERKRGRGSDSGAGGKGDIKRNKSDKAVGGKGEKKDPKKQSFDSLTKEELEKRLERATKYGVSNENVDAMKAALRKFRFEGN